MDSYLLVDTIVWHGFLHGHRVILFTWTLPRSELGTDNGNSKPQLTPIKNNQATADNHARTNDDNHRQRHHTINSHHSTTDTQQPTMNNYHRQVHPTIKNQHPTTNSQQQKTENGLKHLIIRKYNTTMQKTLIHHS
jgi:hypothetical protein